jgi:hypothetical protein
VTGERAKDCESPYPSSARVVNPAGGVSKVVELTSGICGMSHNVSEGEEIHPDRATAVSKGRSRSCSRQGYGGTPRPKGGANR